jgi:uracil-DNA glycosylase family 4
MEPWREDPVPTGVEFEALREHGSRIVWGEGARPAPVVGVLDNPGARADAAGRPFVCGTRQTLRLAMADAGLPESAFYLTFLLKRRPRRAYDHAAAWAASLPVLRRQIAGLSPRVLLCMGDTVAKALWGPDASVRALRGRLLAWEGWPSVVTYHPLAARRRPQLLPLLVADLREAVVHVHRI